MTTTVEPAEILRQTANHVRGKLADDHSGHDWWHIDRVWKSAVHIGRCEGADLFVVQLAVLLHDIADWKFHAGDDTLGPRLAAEWLAGFSLDARTSDHVAEIIKHLSFKGAVPTPMRTLEGRVVQDADRLDAIGAIGIARAFAYGGTRVRDGPSRYPADAPRRFRRLQTEQRADDQSFLRKTPASEGPYEHPHLVPRPPRPASLHGGILDSIPRRVRHRATVCAGQLS